MARQKQSVAQRGFTLLELAVVLTILSVVVTFGINIGQNAISGSERLSTQERLNIIKKSLDAYAERNGYLPCPADPAMLPSNANFALESRNDTVGLGCVIGGGITLNNSVYFGMVPTRTLGLNDSYAADSWTNKFSYAVSANHIGATASGFNSYAANTGYIVVRGGTSLGNTYKFLPDQTGASGNGATYAVISHGKNMRGAYPLNGAAPVIACGLTTAALDNFNCSRGGTIYDFPYNEGTQSDSAFDDYVVWGTNLVARNPLSTLTNSCSSGCEVWCAPCESTRTSTPPSTPTRICSKFIVSTTPCTATCIWPSATSPCP